MTVAATSTSARNDYTGNGTQTVYSFTFEVLNESNSVTGKNYSLRVILTENSVETEQVEDTDYTVTYNSDTRLGSVTFTTAPSSSQTITLLSDISRTQSTDYISIGTDAFPANSHEGTVDKLTLISRELDEKIDRSILLPESSQLSNVTIPVSTANAGKFITVNGDGDDLTASEIADTGSAVSTFAKTLLDDETAAEARGTLGAEQKASGLTAITSLEDDDQLIIADNSDSDASKKVTFGNFFQGIGQVNFTPKTETIESGAITYSGATILLEGEGDADDILTTINGGSDGDRVLLRKAGTNDITVDSGGGNIFLEPDNDAVLGSLRSSLELSYNGGAWRQISRNSNFDFRKGFFSNGYTYLPNGLVIQWGIESVAGDTTDTVTLPVTYSNTNLAAYGSFSTDNTTMGDPCAARVVSTSQITVTNATGATFNIHWLSIGY